MAGMSTYAIGDLQGCLASLEALLPALRDARRLIFVGDLVNRGPQSLATLRAVRRHVESGAAVALLGNHDLHLLAVDAGIRPAHLSDTLEGILDAPDRRELIDWLRTVPLAHMEDGHLFVHAGVPPQWTCVQTLMRAEEVRQRLLRDDYRDFLQRMYGNQPDLWDESLRGDDRLRFIVNALTRLRVVDQLCVDVPVGPIHREAGALRAAGDRLAHPDVAANARTAFRLRVHQALPFAAFPAFLRTYSFS